MAAGLLVLVSFEDVAFSARAAPAPPVAVLDFEVTGDTNGLLKWASRGLADLLTVDLQGRGASTVDRTFIHAVLAEQDLQTAGQTAAGSLTSGRLAGARYVVKGRASLSGASTLHVAVQVVTVPENEAVASAAAEGECPTALDRIVADIGQGVAARLTGALSPPSVVPVKTRTTRPETQILFYRGVEACVMGSPEVGLAWFLCAQETDPGFVPARAWQEKAYRLAGFPEHAALELQEMTEAAGGAPGCTTSRPPRDVHARTVAVFAPSVTECPAERIELVSTGIRHAAEAATLAARDTRLIRPETMPEVVRELDLQLGQGFGGSGLGQHALLLEADTFLTARASWTGKAWDVHVRLQDPLSARNLASADTVSSEADLDTQVRALTCRILESAAAGPTRVVAVSSNEAAALHELPFAIRARGNDLYADVAMGLNAIRRGENRHGALAMTYHRLGRPRHAALEFDAAIGCALSDSGALSAERILIFYQWLTSQGVPAAEAPTNRVAELAAAVVARAPDSLAAGCIWYERGRNAYARKEWALAVTNLQLAVALFQRPAPPAAPPRGHSIEATLASSMEYLIADSLAQLGAKEEATDWLARAEKDRTLPGNGYGEPPLETGDRLQLGIWNGRPMVQLVSGSLYPNERKVLIDEIRHLRGLLGTQAQPSAAQVASQHCVDLVQRGDYDAVCKALKGADAFWISLRSSAECAAAVAPVGKALQERWARQASSTNGADAELKLACALLTYLDRRAQFDSAALREEWAGTFAAACYRQRGVIPTDKIVPAALEARLGAHREAATVYASAGLAEKAQHQFDIFFEAGPDIEHWLPQVIESAGYHQEILMRQLACVESLLLHSSQALPVRVRVNLLEGLARKRRCAEAARYYLQYRGELPPDFYSKDMARCLVAVGATNEAAILVDSQFLEDEVNAGLRRQSDAFDAKTPDDPFAAWCHFGDEFRGAEEWETACACYRQALAVNPRNAKYFVVVCLAGECLLTLGRTAEASDLLAQAVEGGGTDKEMARRAQALLEQARAGSYKSLVCSRPRPEWLAKSKLSGAEVRALETRRMPDSVQNGPCLIVDVSAGSEAAHYPVEWLPELPPDLLSNPEYKRSRIVLRQVPASPRFRSSASAASSRYPAPGLTNVYLAVFETTQSQWEHVMNTRPNLYWSDPHPVGQVSFQIVRGGRWPGEAPGTNAFLGRLSARTGRCCDLPTVEIWNQAASPNEAPRPSLYGRLQSCAVGGWQPNRIGLFDLFDNVCELVLGRECSRFCDTRGASYVAPGNTTASVDSCADPSIGFRIMVAEP